MGDDRVEDEPAGAGAPLGTARVVRQALDVLPGPAVVGRLEQPGGLDARVQPVEARGDVPHGRDLGAVVAVGEALGRMRPGLAEVVAAPHRRPEPRAPGPGEELARRADGDVVDRPAAAQRAADPPVAAPGIAVEDEGALGGAHEQGNTRCHGDPSSPSRGTVVSTSLPGEATAGSSGLTDSPGPRHGDRGQTRPSTRSGPMWVEDLGRALEPAPGAYVNFVNDEGEARVHDAYPPATWARLAEVKRRYDPDNVFNRNQNVPPAAPPDARQVDRGEAPPAARRSSMGLGPGAYRAARAAARRRDARLLARQRGRRDRGRRARRRRALGARRARRGPREGGRVLGRLPQGQPRRTSTATRCGRSSPSMASGRSARSPSTRPGRRCGSAS